MATYDRRAWALLNDCLATLPDRFTSAEVVSWFSDNYPLLDERTVRQHLRGVSANDGTKKHMKSIPAKNLLLKLGRGEFTRYDPERDGLFDDDGERISSGQEPDDELEADFEEGPSREQLAFALESHLEDFLDENMSRIDFGAKLRILEMDDLPRGRQFPIDHGRIDLLCVDEKTNDLIVVELKKGKHSDRVVGQCIRYMGWVRKNLAESGQRVRGVIVTSSADDYLQDSVAVVPDIEVLCYDVSFNLRKPF